MLSEIAIYDPEGFESLVAKAREKATIQTSGSAA